MSICHELRIDFIRCARKRVRIDSIGLDPASGQKDGEDVIAQISEFLIVADEGTLRRNSGFKYGAAKEMVVALFAEHSISVAARSI